MLSKAALQRAGWIWDRKGRPLYTGWSTCAPVIGVQVRDGVEKYVQISFQYAHQRRRPIGWQLLISVLGVSQDLSEVKFVGRCKSILDAIRTVHVLDVSRIVENLRKRKYAREGARPVYRRQRDGTWTPFATLFDGSKIEDLAEDSREYSKIYPGTLAILHAYSYGDHRVILPCAGGGVLEYSPNRPRYQVVKTLPDWCRDK